MKKIIHIIYSIAVGILGGFSYGLIMAHSGYEKIMFVFLMIMQGGLMISCRLMLEKILLMEMANRIDNIKKIKSFKRQN